MQPFSLVEYIIHQLDKTLLRKGMRKRAKNGLLLADDEITSRGLGLARTGDDFDDIWSSGNLGLITAYSCAVNNTKGNIFCTK